MKVTFYIDYATRWGENLALEIAEDDARSRVVDMKFKGGSTWTAEIQIPDSVNRLTYSYKLIDNNGNILRHEYGNPRISIKNGNIARMVMIDRWHDMPADKPFYSTAFTKCVNRRERSTKTCEALTGQITLMVDAPEIRPDQTLAVTGNIDILGNWNPQRALRLNDNRFPTWEVQFPLHELDDDLDFKFLVIDRMTGDVVAWENCDNRSLGHLQADYNIHTTVDCGSIANPLGNWRGAGTAIPVFSVRTTEDFGVGDFYSLIKMVDWCNLTGQRFLQLLPINDTTMTDTWTDSYPYNANSTFALHPMYLHLQAMGTLADPSRRAHFANIAEELNKLECIDYERVTRTKDMYARELFKQDGITVIASDDYKAFYQANSHWLRAYAAFRVLRDRFRTAELDKWGHFANYSDEIVAELERTDTDEMNYHCYVQFFLDKQMRHVRNYAHSKGVAIKGDIPIGISRMSVDAWMYPRLFNLGCQAGAPPDAFSTLGQNWGFPTYNWEEMSRDGFEWWKSRFRKMSEYFDAYRIDHVLGFFRIWQIPMDALHGLLGVFNPALPYTPEEMMQRYGFYFNADLYSKPYIADYMLPNYFGDEAEEVRRTYLTPIEGTNRFTLRPEVDTQRKIVAHFATLPSDERHTHMCEAMMSLLDDVLFIEDGVEHGKYHPRISAQFTDIYASLNDYDKACFNRLYNDFFYHRHNDFWYGKAMWKLPPLIDATNMLVCAEDLGMIPACVPAVMDRLEILSLEIQRMPKDSNRQFGDPALYPYYSVCTTSTHDMGGIRQWWEEDRWLTQEFFNNALHLAGEAPYYAEPWVCTRIVEQHLWSPSMLCILPLQDWLSTDGTLRRENPHDEQINVPANPRHYWRYRMHLTMEQLLEAGEFNAAIRQKVLESGRN